MNNFLDLELRSNFYIYPHSATNTLTADLMAIGHFIKIDNDNYSDVVDAINILNNDELRNSTLAELAKKSPFVFSRRLKTTIKKALILRVFNHIYNSDIKAKDFISFLNHFRSYRYEHNLASYDFNNLEYGFFLSDNANGHKEFGIAKYIKLTDIFSKDELLEIINDFYLFCVTNCESQIVSYVVEAMSLAVNEEN